jgi:predicted thioesterase
MEWPQLIPLDIRLSQTEQVTQALTVQATVPDLPPVYSTPNMILFMEIVCADLIRPYLPAGWVSVGALVDVRHLAASPVGMIVTATARVLEVSKSLVTFEVEAHDGVDLIGRGRHARAPIELNRFLSGCARKQAAQTGA